MGEVDAGGALTVDHYRPLAADGDDGAENLVYACNRCNLYKGEFWPTDEDLAHGHRVLHPLHDDLGQHMHLDEPTGKLVPLTATGRFHIVLLHLNRRALVAHRLRHRLAELLAAKRRFLEEENEQLRSLLAAQERYIAELKRLLGPQPGDVA